jgi:tRNA pseudouridine38-40 synthase
MPRFKMTVEYDGTGFAGWQRQKDALGVQQVLEDALFKMFHRFIEVTGSGRTDAGVHALGQVAHFDLSAAEIQQRKINEFKLREGLNALVRPFAVSVLEITEVSLDFHARFDARRRTYLYVILNRRAQAALEKGKVWHISYPLDEKKMDDAAQILVGRHDFSTFRAAQCQAKSPIKTLDSLHVWRQGERIFIKAEARSFLHHQVRNFAGALAFVGQGKWTKKTLQEALDAKDRRKGAVTAPPDGLYFVKVEYKEETKTPEK